MPITVIVADRHPIVLDALDQLFGRGDEFEVVARCTDAGETHAALAAHRPDVLVSELWTDEPDPLVVVRHLRRDGLPTRVVLFSGSMDEDVMIDATRLGVEGIVLKTMSPPSLLSCVRKVHAGEQWLETRSAGRALDKLVRREQVTHQLARTLTRREVEIARLAAQGRRSKDIAHELCISPSTVRIHLHNIYEKLEVAGHLELTLFAREHGLFTAAPLQRRRAVMLTS